MKTFSLAEVAEMLTVSVRTIEAWIAGKELRAVNVSRNRRSRKARLRVLQSDLDAFLDSRATDQEQGHQPRRRRRIEGVEQFV